MILIAIYGDLYSFLRLLLELGFRRYISSITNKINKKYKLGLKVLALVTLDSDLQVIALSGSKEIISLMDIMSLLKFDRIPMECLDICRISIRTRKAISPYSIFLNGTGFGSYHYQSNSGGNAQMTRAIVFGI
jgi:hypothetical protein